MDSQALRLPHHQQVVMDRFVAACQADARVVAAFLGGSYASGTADAYSDLDLSLITTDAAYEDFLAGREAFIRLLGEPLFLETFQRPNVAFFIFPDGTEGELALGCTSDFTDMNRGAYRVLLDKTGILAGAVFP
ncbi:MAG: nucleotidyltransferase domain-containing protein, partial [Roseiflexaceae bacterium]